MRKYAKYDADGILLGIGTGAGGEEISADEYDNLMALIRHKAALVDDVYAGRITLEDVPDEYRAEIEQRVADRRTEQQDADATEADYQAALEEMGVDLSDEG